ncbi:chromosome condensation protein, putative [Plasmodium sp. DRC-Itaito]|nr:chromosome condensation protein, putative [Plasmodium sp. DRC-Itaito]
MKKLGVNNSDENNGNNIKNKDGTNKKTIEVNKNMRRLTFLNNESSDGIDGNKSKYDKNKVKEINDVFKNCMVALSHNKICTRNAFDIHIIEHLEDLINLNDEEVPEELNDEMIENGEFNLSFTRASKAIEGATKVYGYRVEAIYDQTYNFLTNMNLAKQFELDNDMMDDNKNTIDPLNKRMRKRKLTYLQESSTLAKSSDITVDSLSLSNISVDTFFLKLNSTYDHSCGHKYLLPNLNLNNDLSIQFDGDIDVCEYKKRRKMLDDIRKDVKDKEDVININKNKNDDNCDMYDKITYNNDLNHVDEKKNNDVGICENRNKKNESGNIYVDNFNMNENKEFFDIYKKKLFLNGDILKEILYGGPDDFNSLNICPELDYFKEELKKHKLKRTDSKDTDDVDKEDVDGNLYNDDEIGNTDKNNIINFYDENLGYNMNNNMIIESVNNNDALNTDNKNIFPENVGISCVNLNEMKKKNDMNNSNNNSHNNLDSCNYDHNDLYLGEYRMDDLNIENVMQESLCFDNMNYSCDKNMNFSNNGMLLEQSSHMMDGMNFPELLKSENKELVLGNTQINNEHYLLKNNNDINKRHSIISEVPDDDTLWNRSVMTFENRINAIDINNELNYHYYIPNKLMMMGNFRNLIDINKNVTNNNNNINNNKSTILQNILMQKKMKYAFDITSIDFENLYIENNNIELSTYDLWKKEKKKYVSNALFCIDQTSYIFDTRENCVNCVNTVTDKVMKFSKFCVYPDFLHECNKNRNKHNNNNNNNISNNHMNVILNEVNNDNILNDIDPINQDDFNNNHHSFDMENMDDMNDVHLQEGLNEAIDKFYNMDFDNIWTHNDNKNNDNINKNNNLNNGTYNNNNLTLFKKHSNYFNTALFQFHQSNTFGNVPFENISKFVDVAKIKKILCDIVKPNDEEKENKNDSLCEYQTEKDNQIVTYTAEKTTTFEEIVKETTAKLNESEASSTSVHMLFVCLLYTCNDQELLLEKIPNQNNFYVRYGLPVECHVNHDDVPMLKN